MNSTKRYYFFLVVLSLAFLSIFQNCGNINLNTSSSNSALSCSDSRIFDIGTSYNSEKNEFEFFLRQNSESIVKEYSDGPVQWNINQVISTSPRAVFQLPTQASCLKVIATVSFKNSCGEDLSRTTQFIDPRCPNPPPPPAPPPPTTPPPTPPPPTPPPPPAVLPVDTTPIKNVEEMLHYGCINYFGDLEWWNPVTPIPNFVHPTTGASYVVRIAGAGTIPNTCDRQTFDPMPPGNAVQRTINARHLIFQGVIAFRVRIPSGKSNATFGYTEMNLGTMTAGNLYSVSKYPGEINPSKANSPDYCNLSYMTSFRVSNSDDVAPTVCRIRENEIYFFNVFSPNSIDEDGYIGVGERFVFDLRMNY